jgi:hypothetical protein
MTPRIGRRCRRSQPVAWSWSRVPGRTPRALGNQLGPAQFGGGDQLERCAQYWITRARRTRWVRLAPFVLQIADQVKVGQHGGAQGEAEKRMVVDAESVPIAVVGQQVELAVERLR